MKQWGINWKLNCLLSFKGGLGICRQYSRYEEASGFFFLYGLLAAMMVSSVTLCLSLFLLNISYRRVSVIGDCEQRLALLLLFYFFINDFY